jgi:hypothetical protein
MAKLQGLLTCMIHTRNFDVLFVILRCRLNLNLLNFIQNDDDLDEQRVLKPFQRM